MGQAAGKPARPKPGGEYQNNRVRRRGRRRAFVGFRRFWNGRGRHEHQYQRSERLEWENAQKENSLRTSASVEFSPGLLDEPVLANIGIGEPIYRNVSSRPFEVNVPPFCPFSYSLQGNKISGSFMNPYENSEVFTEYASGGCNDLFGQNGVAFVNIDSYEPDSSDGEEDVQDTFSLVEGAGCVFQATLDTMFSELENMQYFTDLKSSLSTLSCSVSTECCEEAGPMPLLRYRSVDSGLVFQDNGAFDSYAEDHAVRASNFTDSIRETQQANMVDVGIGSPTAIANELNVSDERADQGNSTEPVVRPKIRRPRTASQLEREQLFSEDSEEESGSLRRNEAAGTQQRHSERALRNNKDLGYSVFLDSREYEGHQKNAEMTQRKNAAAQEQNQVVDDSTVWDDFEDCNRRSFQTYDDEDSSEWSDGEWSTAVSAYFTATEKDQSSSDESWETARGREDYESEVRSASSGRRGNRRVYSREGERTVLEEGEIPWLRYRDDTESSSDEESYPVSSFVLPRLFPLHRNNSVEDDSSVSEDLEWSFPRHQEQRRGRSYWRIDSPIVPAEDQNGAGSLIYDPIDSWWSERAVGGYLAASQSHPSALLILLEEFGYSLWLPQAIPYVVPQFPTFMALEGHSQQLIETALVHLESLGFDVEHAHPPATKETIDSLPEIIFEDDHESESQQQSCTICCSEYVKGESVTELPCHHLFHKPCVTRWLQKSGTCPVCRHVLAPTHEEAAAAAAVLSDDNLTSPVDSATGTSN